MIYKFRELSPKDQMRLEVDFYGEPVEITGDMIIEVLKREMELSLEPNYKGVYIDNLEKTAEAILKLFEE